MAAATWRFEKLNEILPPLMDKFEEALTNGVLLELAPQDISWMNDLLELTSGEL